MINYVVYSNTSYLDILEIQTEKLKHKSATLFINKNDKDLDHLYSNYQNVIFYDEDQPYAQRLLSCLNNYNNEYFLLLHDIDILLYSNEEKLIKMLNFMVINNFDRIDIKRTELKSGDKKYDITDNDQKNWMEVNEIIGEENLFLVKQTNPNDYVYNVNPSFWRKSTLIEIMRSFSDKTYRTIEGIDVQNYCTKYEIYRTYSKNYKRCGYYNCINDFIFLHITHNGRFLPLNEQKVTPYGQSYLDVYDDYINIVQKYNLINSEKW